MFIIGFLLTIVMLLFVLHIAQFVAMLLI